jgi:hypothetical protein
MAHEQQHDPIVIPSFLAAEEAEDASTGDDRTQSSLLDNENSCFPMSQDCVEWDECGKRDLRFVVEASVNPSMNMMQRRTSHAPPLEGSTDEQFTSRASRQQQRKGFPLPLHKSLSLGTRTTLQFCPPPPSRKRSISWSGQDHCNSQSDLSGINRHEKVAKVSLSGNRRDNNEHASTISPVPGSKGPQLWTGFEVLYSKVKTPSPDGTIGAATTTPSAPTPSTTGSERLSGPLQKANSHCTKSSNEEADASEVALNVRPTSLNNQAFNQPATTDKENKSNKPTSLKKRQTAHVSSTIMNPTPRAPLQQHLSEKSNNGASSACSLPRSPSSQRKRPDTGTSLQRVPSSIVSLFPKGDLKTATVNAASEDDEFGDLEISEEDLAALDPSDDRDKPKTENVLQEEKPTGVSADDFSDVDLTEDDLAALDARDSNDNNPKVIDVKAPCATNEVDDDDEFGDLGLSDADFAALDVAVSAGQQIDLSQHNIERDRCPTNSKTVATFSGLPAAQLSGSAQPQIGSINPSQATTVNDAVACNNKDDDGDDPFGDFPDDIDFDALDQSIATQQERNNGNGCYVPSPNCVVRNATAESWQEETSYLSFSRYRIHRVEKDLYTFTQVWFLELWDSTMLHDLDTQAIHKQSNGAQNRSKVSKENRKEVVPCGVLVLRGSWFYVEVEEGDVFHLCSLTGRFRTDPSALPIVLNSDPPEGSDCDGKSESPSGVLPWRFRLIFETALLCRFSPNSPSRNACDPHNYHRHS